MTSEKTSIFDNEAFCKVLLTFTAVTWGVSFVFMKDVTQAFAIFWTLTIRFAIATLFCVVLLWRRIAAGVSRRTLTFGLKNGILLWLGYIFQTAGIFYTTPGKNAFLTTLYCVIVPFCAWGMGLGRPKGNNFIGAVVAVVGLGFVALDGGLPINRGDALTLVCALWYALQMAYTSKSGGSCDIWVASIVQFAVVSVFSLPIALVFETAPTRAAFTPELMGSMVFLAIVCTSLAMLFFNHAFTKVDPTAGALIATLESPTGVLFSVIVTHEILTGRVLLGFVLILVGVLISEAGGKLLERLKGEGVPEDPGERRREEPASSD